MDERQPFDISDPDAVVEFRPYKKVVTEAARIECDFTVGDQKGEPGDYLTKDAFGGFYHLPAFIFETSYQLVRKCVGGNCINDAAADFTLRKVDILGEGEEQVQVPLCFFCARKAGIKV